jgi:biotin carboxylase
VKVVALWKYHKLSINQAPFVYQCSELISIIDENNNEQETNARNQICEYCVNLLKSLGMKWGPTHTEIKLSSYHHTPRLMEVNPRWHAQNFVNLTRNCLGQDAVTSTLDAFFAPSKMV